ncbi:MGMT family protein [candidate division WOR-3 bacterium]|nr:MGMT family protein [candidate division WOR-3 bacterium]
MHNINGFTKRVIFIIRNIPEGNVLTYGKVAGLAGKPYGSRQVSWLLHSLSGEYNLPWHRVINSQGKISLRGEGYRQQRMLLELEGVEFSSQDKISLKKYLWEIETIEEIDRYKTSI